MDLIVIFAAIVIALLGVGFIVVARANAKLRAEAVDDAVTIRVLTAEVAKMDGDGDGHVGGSRRVSLVVGSGGASAVGGGRRP